MRVLLAPTEDFIKRDRTLLMSDTTAGVTTMSVGNSNGFVVNDWIVVGPEGSEQAELVQVTSVGTGVIGVTLLLAHKSDEPIVKYRFNQRKFYGCATQTGTYTQLVSYGSPKAIQVGDPQGTVLEYTGGEGYLYFKSTYWNTITSEESDIADSNPVLADESVRYCSLYAIRKQAGLTNNPYITDGVVEVFRKRAENEVNSYLYSRYILPLANSTGSAEIPFVVENTTTLLAAGYMDYQEFGSDGEGVKWLGEARAVLNSAQKGTQRLIGLDGQEFSQKTLTQGIQSYPDGVDNNNGPIRVFTNTQKF